MKNTQKGFIVQLLLVVIALLFVGGGAYVYTQNKQANQLEQEKLLSLARAKADDGNIQVALVFIQDQAKIYYGVTGNTYIGVCGDSNVQKYLTVVQTANGGTAPICNSSATEYAFSSPLATDKTKFMCVDSIGPEGKTLWPSVAALGTNTICPR